MAGILIISHGNLGESLIQCAEHIMGGVVPRLGQLAVSKRDQPEEVLERAKTLLHTLDDGNGVLVLTDIFGGTPSNTASKLLNPGKVEVIAGINLPMLVRALTYRTQPLAIVVEKALSGGTQGIIQSTLE